MLNFTKEELLEKKGFDTLNEICHQPETFISTYNIVKDNKKIIVDFFKNSWFDKKNTRIIITGAGSSEFASTTIANYLQLEGFDAFSISTTDIVTSIKNKINPDVKTILVSVARSGDSPESAAAIKKVKAWVKDLKQIIITCNINGKLSKINSEINIVLDEKTNDISLAMTSSFTSLILSTILVFNIDKIDELENDVKDISIKTKNFITSNYVKINDIAKLNYNRLIYLGSDSLQSLAQESSLKSIELTSGKIDSYYNSPVGFRHGPKAVLNNKTICVVFVNSDEYKRKYDIDLINEINSQNLILKLITVSNNKLDIESDINFELNIKDNNYFANIIYVVFGQLLAFYKSINLNISPDNPSLDGNINRVVKNIIIYDN